MALQQGVGGNGCAHTNRSDARRVDGAAKKTADALDGRILISLRILGQELERFDRALGAAPDHIGKGATAVNPEIPDLVHIIRPHFGSFTFC